MNRRREAILWGIAITASFALGLIVVWAAIALAFSRPNPVPLYFAAAVYRQDDYSAEGVDTVRLNPLDPSLEQEAIREDEARNNLSLNVTPLKLADQATPTVALPVSANTPPTQAATNAPVPAPTDTPLPASTNTAVPAPTDTPLPVSTNTTVPVPTNTFVPVPINTPLPAPTNTAVPAPTNPTNPDNPNKPPDKPDNPNKPPDNPDNPNKPPDKPDNPNKPDKPPKP